MDYLDSCVPFGLLKVSDCVSWFSFLDGTGQANYLGSCKTSQASSHVKPGCFFLFPPPPSCTEKPQNELICTQEEPKVAKRAAVVMESVI